MFVIICNTGNLIYLRNLVNTWQPHKLPSLASRIPESYAKVKTTPETCHRDRKRWDKCNDNFWNAYEYVITAICINWYSCRRQTKVRLNYILWLKLAQIHAPWLKNVFINPMVYLGMVIATWNGIFQDLGNICIR